MATGVQKTMLQGPVLGQIVPPIVFLLPALMAQLTYQGGREGLRHQRANPEPFVIGSFGLKLAASVVILSQLLLGTYDPYGLGVIG